MFDLHPPHTTATLIAALESQSTEIDAYLTSLSTEEFLAPQGEAWSPAGHARHLVKSVRAVTAGMKVPRLLLWLRFGRAQSGSRSFEEVRELYLAALAQGAQAGRFGPSDRKIDLDPEDWRQVIMERWREASRELAKVARAWPEPALDRYRLPHPVLGKMTVREILFFTLYHNRHHAARVLERASARLSGESPDRPAVTEG